MKGSARRLYRAGIALVLLWATYGALIEVYRCGWLWRHDPWPATEAGSWRWHSRHVTRLAHFLEAAEPHLPATATVAFSAAPGSEREGFLHALWAAYLLPEHALRHATEPSQGLTADYWLAYGHDLDEHPRLEAVAAPAGGMLYRARPLDPR